ncbi:MAG: hypothetical protein F4091_05380 [Acidimicrobiales bacterium]|nr:hypothetical protein [Acidimicrobiales bacterium]MYD84449.1 hypothetical protein [Acidimicrobiales bacterium]MYJ64885.1 hypothetical protein [Acidimicrobiales bacterium]
MNDDGASASGNEIAQATTDGGLWPVYKGSSFNLWEPDTGIYYDSALAAEMISHLHNKRLSQRKKASSAFADQPTEITDDPATLPCRHPRIAFRNVTNPTNTRSFITALVPGELVIVHHAPYLVRVEGTPAEEAYTLGVLSSMPLDWQVRRTVELNMTFEQLNLLSIPDPGLGHPVRDRVVEVAGRLGAVDDRFAEWAAEVGVPVGSANDAAAKQDLIHELDACVAHLYGLDEDDLEVIYTTFDGKRPDRYRHRLAAVLDHFRRLP